MCSLHPLPLLLFCTLWFVSGCEQETMEIVENPVIETELNCPPLAYIPATVDLPTRIVTRDREEEVTRTEDIQYDEMNRFATVLVNDTELRSYYYGSLDNPLPDSVVHTRNGGVIAKELWGFSESCTPESYRYVEFENGVAAKTVHADSFFYTADRLTFVKQQLYPQEYPGDTIYLELFWQGNNLDSIHQVSAMTGTYTYKYEYSELINQHKIPFELYYGPTLGVSRQQGDLLVSREVNTSSVLPPWIVIVKEIDYTLDTLNRVTFVREENTGQTKTVFYE